MSDPWGSWPGPGPGADPAPGAVPPGPGDRPAEPVAGDYLPPGAAATDPRATTWGPGGRGQAPYPGGAPPGPTPAGRPGAGRRNPRAYVWGAIVVVIGLALLATHRITETDVLLFAVIVPSIILHEIAHGWVALAFGDDTAKRAGRLTLNPLAHIDPIGTLLVPALLAVSGLGFFGWAKPVPVNLGRLRSPRNQGVLVSLAGPATNLVLAVGGAVALHFLFGPVPVGYLPAPLWAQVLFLLGLVNVGLAVFNLIPIPPLDGSVLLERLMPRSWWPAYLRIRPYTMPIVLGLVLLNFYMHPGPITWLFDRIDDGWSNLLAR